MKVGQTIIPPLRTSALLKGEIVQLDLGGQQGRWSIICSLPPFEFAESVFLNQYHRTIQQEKAGFIGILPRVDSYPDPQLPKIRILTMPLVVDPTPRLGRVLELTGVPAANRCQSYIVDPQGVIRNHSIHMFNWRGFFILLDMLKNCQQLYPVMPGRQPIHAMTFFRSQGRQQEPASLRTSNLYTGEMSYALDRPA